MMNLKNMVTGLESDRVAEQLMAYWEHNEGSVKFWRASSNFVYVFQYDQATYFLRFSFEQHSTIEQIEAEFDFMNYLIAHGYPCVQPIPSKNARWVETVRMHDGNYYGVVFSQAAGSPLETDSMTEHHFTNWGQSLAQLHSLSQSYQPAGQRRKDWHGILTFVRETLHRYPSETEASAELERMEGWLVSLPQSTDTFGLIHYDFQTDNVCWDDRQQQYQVFDFDDSMYHWFAMDIVAALYDLFEQKVPDSPEKISFFLDGYRSIRPLDEDMVDRFPHFLTFSKLYDFCRLLRSLENSELDDAPSWHEGLREKLINKTNHLRRGFRQPW